MISPLPFSSGLSILRSVPPRVPPTDLKLNLLLLYMVTQAVVSLMPYTPRMGMSKEAK
jgi:hypothetical protein